MLSSKRHLSRSADKHEKKSVSVKEIQNCRGKQWFAISNGCFSPLGGFDVQSCKLEVLLDNVSFTVIEIVHGKKIHFRLALLPAQFKCIHKETKWPKPQLLHRGHKIPASTHSTADL